MCSAPRVEGRWSSRQVAYQPFVEEFLAAISGNATGPPPPPVWVAAILDALPPEHLDMGGPAAHPGPLAAQAVLRQALFGF